MTSERTPVLVVELKVRFPSFDVRSDLEAVKIICDRLQDFIKEQQESSYVVREIRWSE